MLDLDSIRSEDGKLRIIQESVPGRQITLSHIIANPDKVLYRKLGLDPEVEYSATAIGIMTVCPAETAIIAADVCLKSSGAELGFVDRFSGTVIITGTFSEVESALTAANAYAKDKLGYAVCEMTKT